ncbi:protein Wnt-5b-like [Coccinella septempunctata]|uniref:protein Wnt-5b-like n=1 Tax=Coccinella septempunctata TaxID=41139 RepID=UPI001D06A33F|nr:protein Wnt-5b-like [Coccinella septempunctata]
MRFGERPRRKSTADMTQFFFYIVTAIFINSAGAARRSRINGTWLRMGLMQDEMMQSDQSTPSCLSLPGLTPGQSRICHLYIDHMNAVALGAKTALAECKHQFHGRRWNCSILDDVSVLGPVLNMGSRESAFAHALAAAGVAYAISRACKDGQLSSCGCSRMRRPKDLRKDWVWGGCGDNLDYAYKFTQTFVDITEKERRYKRGTRAQGKSLMNLHNNEAGRRAVIKNSKVTCKCHGVSGSCSLITCWQQMATFREIGDYLREKYDGATEVRVNRRGRLQLRDPRVRLPTAQDLVYMEDSPNYCIKDDSIGSLGTQGRICSRTSQDLDGCNLLCCGRGYNTLNSTVVERCDCKFKWCCQVECKTCVKSLDVHTCK